MTKILTTILLLSLGAACINIADAHAGRWKKWDRSWQQCTLNTDCILLAKHPCKHIAVNKKKQHYALNFLVSDSTLYSCTDAEKAFKRSQVNPPPVCDYSRHCNVRINAVNGGENKAINKPRN